jgi:Tfp pilus assembly protein PilF
VEVRRRIIHHCEVLYANFPEAPQHGARLVRNYLSLVALLWQRNQQSKAAEPFPKALALAPDDAAVNNEVAWFLVTVPEPRFRDSAEAVRRARKDVTASPEEGNYWNTLGVARYRAGDHKGAVADLEKSVLLQQGGDSFDWFILAMANWRLGDHVKARRWYHKAENWLRQHPSQNATLRLLRGEAEGLLGIASKGN